MAAGQASASLDKLATWFLAAFGGALALILTHLKDLSEFITSSSVACAAHLFLWAAALCFVQRYVAMIVVSGASSAKEGREMGEKLEHMDGEEFIAQVKSGMPRLLRPLASGLLDAVAKGDFVVGSRLFLRRSMLQGVLVTAEVVVLLVALSRLVNAIKA